VSGFHEPNSQEICGTARAALALGRKSIELMPQWTRRKADAAEDDVGVALAVDPELFRLDSAIR
jgi:hypothetical protein